ARRRCDARHAPAAAADLQGPRAATLADFHGSHAAGFRRLSRRVRQRSGGLHDPASSGRHDRNDELPPPATRRGIAEATRRTDSLGHAGKCRLGDLPGERASRAVRAPWPLVEEDLMLRRAIAARVLFFTPLAAAQDVEQRAREIVELLRVQATYTVVFADVHPSTDCKDP